MGRKPKFKLKCYEPDGTETISLLSDDGYVTEKVELNSDIFDEIWDELTIFFNDKLKNDVIIRNHISLSRERCEELLAEFNEHYEFMLIKYQLYVEILFDATDGYCIIFKDQYKCPFLKRKITYYVFPLCDFFRYIQNLKANFMEIYKKSQETPINKNNFKFELIYTQKIITDFLNYLSERNLLIAYYIDINKNVLINQLSDLKSPSSSWIEFLEKFDDYFSKLSVNDFMVKFKEILIEASETESILKLSWNSFRKIK